MKLKLWWNKILITTAFLASSSCEVEVDPDLLGERTPFVAKESGEVDDLPPLALEFLPNLKTISAGDGLQVEVLATYPTLESVKKGLPKPGETKNITALISEWVVSDPKVMTFDPETFRLTTSIPGTANLEAKIDDLTATLVVDVTKPVIRAIDILPIEGEYHAGQTVCLKAQGIYSDFTMVDLTESVDWKSLDETMAEPFTNTTEKNCFRLLLAGDLDISAKFREFEDLVTIKGRPAVLERLYQPASIVNLPLGAEAEIKVFGIYSDQTEVELTTQASWSVVAPNIANIALNGLTATLKANEIGMANIRAKIGELEAISALVVEDAALQNIIVTPNSGSKPLGYNQKFAATGEYSDGTAIDLTTVVSWVSSNPILANFLTTPGDKGTLKTNAIGSVTITAQYKELTGTTNFSVEAATLTEIRVNPSSVSRPKGLNQNFTATGIFSNGSEVDVTETASWTTSNPLVFSVSNSDGSKGQGATGSPGGASVRATIGSFVGTSSVTTTNAQLLSISFSPANPTAKHGLKRNMTALGTYTDGATLNITNQVFWFVDYSLPQHEKVAWVSNSPGEKGQVYTFAEGDLLLKAALGDLTAQTTFVVTEKEISSIQVTPGNTTYILGQDQQYTATGIYTDGSTLDITNASGPDLSLTWSSSYPGIAPINHGGTTGLLQTLVEGITTITASLTSPWGSFYTNSSVTVQSSCSSGIRVSYYCWYLGQAGESCDTTCSNVAANYHPATRFYSGSNAALATQCRDVLQALISPSTNLNTPSATNPDGHGLGCSLFTGLNTTVRYTAPDTTSDAQHASFRRVCACDD